MNNLENSIKINAYSGYKANERPLNFTMGGLKVEIIKVIDRWAEPDRNYFRVQGDNGKIYTLYWDREKDLWSVEKISKPDSLKKCV